nr:MAG TPA_asm: hypothetical protein [Caudoviricetes sp.]
MITCSSIPGGFGSRGFLLHKKCVIIFEIPLDIYTNSVYNRKCKEGRT